MQTLGPMLVALLVFAGLALALYALWRSVQLLRRERRQHRELLEARRRVAEAIARDGRG
jgi:type II secretory pathway component PulJ